MIGLCTTVWVAMGIAPSAHAIVVPEASYIYSCESDLLPDAPGEYQCEREVNVIDGPPNYHSISSGSVELYSGVPEFDPDLPADIRQQLLTELGNEEFILFATVQMETSITVDEGDPFDSDTRTGFTSGGATLAFGVGLQKHNLQPPPFPVDELPIKIRIVGEMRVTGRDGSAELVATGWLGDLRWLLPGPGSLSVDETVDTEFFGVGDVMLFSKSASCNAATDWVSLALTGDSASADCVAVIDPVFELDQDRFDAIYGAASFPLQDYYQLVYSPNLGVGPPIAVPALPNAALVWLLCSFLALSGWVFARSRRHAG